MAAGEATDEDGHSEEEAENRSAQAKEHWDENEDMGNDLEDRSEKEGELDYPMSPTSVMTSGYGTYRPDSSRDNHEGDGYHDDCTLTEPEDDSEAQFDAQYYVDNYNLSMKDNTFSSDVMLSDGQLRNKPNSPDLPEHCSNHTDSDHEGRGLYVVDEGLVLECNVDDSVQGDEAVEGESQHRDNEVFDPNEQRSRESHTASGVQKVTVRNENDFSSLCDSYEHPFNLRSNKWKYFQRRRLEGTKFDRKTRRQKKSGVSGLEECLDRLQMSGMRRPQDSELESQELDSLSSVGELPSAFQAYFKGIVRSRSENDIRPRPKSFIRPLMDHPHTRNLKKTDPVTKYFQYKQEWDTFKAPGERDRRALHWAIREQLMYQPPPPRPQKVLVPNTYVVPTDKKRSALRWEIRHDLANGIMPSKMAYP
ncbi:uncharacterized protein hyls1 isoform X1 [Clupea harengus]|uniref:Uncharacterized protein hyls1 isoform X1 n=1 Tax=Clupea harengus TaxID=7950 RepID=A0A6P8F7P0_CLUHA|nr:uncharacterized protein hyls1 isoform X1 [Clupea harengus]